MVLRGDYRARLQLDPVCIVDVGARGGPQTRWNSIRQACTFVGFEPDKEEAERLRSRSAPNEHYLAVALHSRAATATLHHCVVSARSSLYLPNKGVITDIYGHDEHYRIARTEEVDLTTLDAVLETGTVPSPDFLKLDTQGSELDILRGASGALAASVLLIEAEVEFVPLYQEQPLFPDVDAFLRTNGFQLLRFGHLYTKADLLFGQRADRGYRNLFDFFARWIDRAVGVRGSWMGSSQLIYTDALYARRPDHLLPGPFTKPSEALGVILQKRILAAECARMNMRSKSGPWNAPFSY